MSRAVLVTGAAGAFGAAACTELRERGERVIGLDVKRGPDIIECDIRDGAAVERAVAEAVERLGGLDVLVNAAGIGAATDAGAPPDDEVQAVLDVNFLGAWRVTAAAQPALLERHGRVVNVASGLAAVNVPLAAAYSASKRALSAWSDALRLEYAGRLEVTVVNPGYVRTPIHEAPRARGVGLEGAIPAEPLSATVEAIVAACLGKPRRERASTRSTAAAMRAARVAPGLVDRLVALRSRGIVAGAEWHR
jgi:NAD(P)-dependent dehydrogenase (short-subunit alcohol dehydrogenase family)